MRVIINHLRMGQMAISKKQLIIGLDIGSAFTKVVVADKHVRYAIPFMESSASDNQYLVPTALYVSDDNLCHLFSLKKANSLTDGIAFANLESSTSNEECTRLSAFLALVFRRSTAWLLEHYKKRYARSELAWAINLSLSAMNIVDEKRFDRYQKIFHTAWVVSVLPGPITLSRVAQYMTLDESVFDAFPMQYRSKIISKKSIQIFLENQAYGCAFMHLQQTKNILSLFVDVGASHINISTFIKTNNVTNKYKLCFNRNEKIGVSYLLTKRYGNLQLAAKEVNLFENVPSNADFSQAHDRTEKDITFADTLYSGELVRLINQILDQTRKQYFPDLELWPDNVATFVIGGGAQTDLIKNIIQSLEKKSPPRKISSVKLGMPEDLMAEKYTENLFGRLSLAYGLSLAKIDTSSNNSYVPCKKSEEIMEV